MRRICSRWENLVTTDAGIACFDSKLFYQFWRPITAIRNADKDGNPDTTADPAWAVAARSARTSRVPVTARLLHGGASPAALAAALHTQHIDVDHAGRSRTAAPSSPPASTSTPCTTSSSRSSTRASGSASTSATPSSRATNLGNDVAKWVFSATSNPSTTNPSNAQRVARLRAGHPLRLPALQGADLRRRT